MREVVIFGNTKRAEMLHFYLTHDSPYQVVAFTVDQDYIKEETLCGLPVVPFEQIEYTHPPDDYKMMLAVFADRVNKTRAEKYYQAKAKGYELANYISSKAITWPGLVIGDNCMVFENTVCQSFAEIGNNVIIRSGCSIGHHSVIKDHCFLATDAVVLGGVTVEPYCFLGANSTIRDGIIVARECIVGAGALILKDTEEKCVYKGNPAVLLPKKSDELRKI